MQKAFFLLILTIYTLNGNAQNWNREEPWQKQTLSGKAIKEVMITTSGGSISVSGVNESEARLEVYIYPNNQRNNETFTKVEIEERLANYDLNISISNNQLTATAKPKENNLDWRKALNISFKVFVPQQASSRLITSGGSIHLSRLSGTQDFSTSGGSLHIDQLSGITKGRTSGGSIKVSNTRDFIDLSTSGGSIKAQSCMGNVSLNTSGGSLELNALQGVIKAHTSGGSIRGSRIDGEMTTSTSGGSISLTGLSCSLDASTSSGRLDVSINKLAGSIRLRNSSGNISLQLPAGAKADLQVLADRVDAGTLSNFNGSMIREEVTGKLNGGGVPVTIRASSGRVTLSMQ